MALVLCGLAGYRAIRPDAALFAGQPPASLADAILHGSVEQAYAFIRDGQDPNALLAVEDRDFAGGARRHVSPMVLAVAARQANTATMLLGAGARLDLPDNMLAICLARELDNDEVREALQAFSPPGQVSCPEHALTP